MSRWRASDVAGPTDATRSARARARPFLLRQLAVVGELPCPRCGHLMYPWQDLDVGHPEDVATVGVEAASTMVLRLEHMSCNRRAGDGRVPAPVESTPHINSRDW